MFWKTIITLVILIISAVSANAATTAGIQGGLTHFKYGAIAGEEEATIGYRGDIVMRLPGEKWAGEVDFRAMGYPGAISGADFALDVAVTRYFMDGPLRPYAGAILGFGVKRIHFDEPPKGVGSFGNNSVRVGGKAGLRYYFGANYLDFSGALVLDAALGDTVEKMFDTYYRENERNSKTFADAEAKAEFFWGFTDKVGLTLKAGIIADGYMLNTEVFKGTDVLFFYQVGPSFNL